MHGDKDIKLEALPQRIAFNLFPQVDVFLDNGYTKEEMKFVNESRKIMHHPTLMISATCVRVPVLRAHSEAVNIEFERPMTPDEARAILSKAPGLRSWTIPPTKNIRCPSMPRECTTVSWAAFGRTCRAMTDGESSCSSVVINS